MTLLVNYANAPARFDPGRQVPAGLLECTQSVPYVIATEMQLVTESLPL